MTMVATPTITGPLLHNPGLALLADTLHDVEGVRIATKNRYQSLTRGVEDVDGVTRGLGFTQDHPIVAQTADLLLMLEQTENQAIKNLQKSVKATIFSPWITAQKGVGEKQAARLIAAIGDPYWNDLHDRPRTVSELWAYCGYAVKDGSSQRRTKGQKSNWSDTARMRAYLVATSCVKSNGHYRDVYDAAREQYSTAIHTVDCVRCGPSGKPALAGTELSAGHQHARALRKISKEILKDLWIIARDHYNGVAE